MTEECLEIVKKLDDISQNQFYTINVYDVGRSRYLGDCELIAENDEKYQLIQSYFNTAGEITSFLYAFYKDGTYSRTIKEQDLGSIISRLKKIEQQLGL